MTILLRIRIYMNIAQESFIQQHSPHGYVMSSRSSLTRAH